MQTELERCTGSSILRAKAAHKRKSHPAPRTRKNLPNHFSQAQASGFMLKRKASSSSSASSTPAASAAARCNRSLGPLRCGMMSSTSAGVDGQRQRGAVLKRIGSDTRSTRQAVLQKVGSCPELTLLGASTSSATHQHRAQLLQHSTYYQGTRAPSLGLLGLNFSITAKLHAVFKVTNMCDRALSDLTSLTELDKLLPLRASAACWLVCWSCDSAASQHKLEPLWRHFEHL